MAKQDSRFTLEEYRGQVLVILRRVGQTRILNNVTIESVQRAKTFAQLAASINDAIIRNGINGAPRGDLEVIKGFIKIQYPG